jgi:uncharacterized protein
MKGMTFYESIAFIAVLVGGINWGLIGLFKLDLIQAIFGTGLLYRLIFILIGIAAGYLIYSLFIAKKIPPPPAAS